jgi:hypothetical protein
MILQQAMMQLSKSGSEKKVPKLVMLSEYGLAIHKDVDSKSEAWVISHFNSGRSVLKYMQCLYDEVMNDWTFTEEEWGQYSNEEKGKIKVGVEALQQEILKEEA